MKTIFLDLEETVIESVDNPKELHSQITAIKKFIQPEDKIILFSFALWEPKDLSEKVSKIVLENFGSFEVVWKLDLLPLFKSKFGIKDDLDFMDFSNDKQTVFLLFITEQCLSGTVGDCIFFDDKIQTFNMTINEKLIQLKNVKEL